MCVRRVDGVRDTYYYRLGAGPKIQEVKTTESNNKSLWLANMMSIDRHAVDAVQRTCHQGTDSPPEHEEAV